MPLVWAMMQQCQLFTLHTDSPCPTPVVRALLLSRHSGPDASSDAAQQGPCCICCPAVLRLRITVTCCAIGEPLVATVT